MKTLKSVGIILIIILGLFFMVGLFIPSIEYGHEVSTNKSIEESWAVTQDTTKYHLWLEGFKSIKLISGEEGKAGSKYLVIVNPGEGQDDFTMEETVVSIAQNDSIKLLFDSDMMIFEQLMYVGKDDKGVTLVGTKSKVQGKNILMKSMFALMHYLGGSFQAQEEKNIETLKQVINQNEINYFPKEIITEVDSVKYSM